MIKENTVFILGAGASFPYGFPTGAGLREEICNNLYARYIDYAEANIAKKEILAKRKTLYDFIDTFRNSHNKSIDIFMARNPHLSSIGKYIISHEILSAEKKSDFGERSQQKKQDWYSYIFNRMTASILNKKDISNFSKNKISFITFNYDRSLEHFLYTSLCNSFSDVPKEEIAHEINKLNIFHVYGSVAPLDWQDNANGIQYRIEISEDILQKSSQNLKTIYEVVTNTNDDGTITIENPKIYISIEKAKRIFFLGFGYADENMDILELPQAIPLGSEIHGTGLGLEPNEIKQIDKQIWDGKPKGTVSIFPHEAFIHDMDCLQLLRNYL